MKMNANNETNHAYQNTEAWAQSITKMVSALALDWDRLEELKDMDPADMDARDWEEWHELQEASGDCMNRDDAEERIRESALSVEVRTGWNSPGEEMTPEEFRIVLTTGGPGLQIRGELDGHGKPCRAWLEYQDWGTPWTEYHGEYANQAALLAFAGMFQFGQ
jgi:hypothetical protein